MALTLRPPVVQVVECLLRVLTALSSALLLCPVLSLACAHTHNNKTHHQLCSPL